MEQHRRKTDTEEDRADKPVTNELFYAILKGISDNNKVLKEQVDVFEKGLKEQLNRIELQTMKTNGRVTGLENWRSYIAGGLAILTMIGLPMMWILINDVKELRESKTVYAETINK